MKIFFNMSYSYCKCLLYNLLVVFINFFNPFARVLTINIVNTILPAENNLLERLQM